MQYSCPIQSTLLRHATRHTPSRATPGSAGGEIGPGRLSPIRGRFCSCVGEQKRSRIEDQDAKPLTGSESKDLLRAVAAEHAGADHDRVECRATVLGF